MSIDSEYMYGVSMEEKERRWSMAEVGEMLLGQTPGCLVIDLDFTLKPKEYELGLGGKAPGRVPEESIKLLKTLKGLGWEILLVSNQPKKGHQISRFIKKVRNKDYSIFPDSLVEILGEDGVVGGGKDFLWKKYKDSPEAIEYTINWTRDRLGVVSGDVYFVGDRESDVVFADRVISGLKDCNERRKVNVIKVDGFKVAGVFKTIDKLIP